MLNHCNLPPPLGLDLLIPKHWPQGISWELDHPIRLSAIPLVTPSQAPSSWVCGNRKELILHGCTSLPCGVSPLIVRALGCYQAPHQRRDTSKPAQRLRSLFG